MGHYDDAYEAEALRRVASLAAELPPEVPQRFSDNLQDPCNWLQVNGAASGR